MIPVYFPKFYMKITTCFLACLFSVITISLSASAETSPALKEFYQLEQQNWIEYIQRFPGTDEPDDWDVKFYQIDVEISIDTEYITGNVLCSFESLTDSLARVEINLHHAYQVDSITGNVTNYLFQNDTLLVQLDQGYSPGESAEIQIYYQGEPELAGGYKGLRYETHGNNEPIIATLSTPFLAHYWWPCKDGPGDKPDSVYIDLTIPDTSIAGLELIAVSNGTLDEVVVNAGKKTFKWRERYPIVTYYVMAAISNFATIEEMYSGAYGENFPLTYYCFREDSAISQAGVEDMPEAMDALSSYFGVYPFSEERYGMTQLGYYGAIENQTNTIINTMEPSWFEISVHELAHMWFGDMITCQDWHHGWLNEGFATYSEALWAEYNGGITAYHNNIAGHAFYGGGTLYLQDITNPFQIFISIIYDKGAYVLHMLRGVLGDDSFFQCLDNYANDPALMYDHAVTEDFRAICEAETGMDLEFFFDQWVYDEYYPIYRYSYNQDMSTYETDIIIEQIQGGSGWRDVFEMPVQLEFSFTMGEDTTVTVWNDESYQVFTVDFDAPIYSMEFDPEDWILKSASYVNAEDNILPTVPGEFELSRSYPNPFNTRTSIDYVMGADENVWLKVFNIEGRLVANLFVGFQTRGSHRVFWKGINNSGEEAGSGIYIINMKTDTFTDSRKIILLK